MWQGRPPNADDEEECATLFVALNCCPTSTCARRIRWVGARPRTKLLLEPIKPKNLTQVGSLLGFGPGCQAHQRNGSGSECRRNPSTGWGSGHSQKRRTAVSTAQGTQRVDIVPCCFECRARPKSACQEPPQAIILGVKDVPSTLGRAHARTRAQRHGPRRV